MAALQKAWLKLGELLNRIISPVALGLVFYFVICPFGFLARLFNLSAIKTRKSPELDSYWQHRQPPGPKSQSLYNQF